MLRPSSLVSYRASHEEKVVCGHTSAIQNPCLLDPWGGWASPLEVPHPTLGAYIYFFTRRLRAK